MRMGLKPHNCLYPTNPFTEVNGNLKSNSYFAGYFLPSALADGFKKLPLPLALASFWLVTVKCLIETPRSIPITFGRRGVRFR